MNLDTVYHGNTGLAYGSKQRLQKHFKKSDVEAFLNSSDIYTKFKRSKRAKSYNPIYVREARELWQADCIFFTNKHLVRENGGYKYILSIIDAATKYTWNIPLKSLKCNNEILAAFKHVLKTCGKIPEKIQTDRGE